MAFTYTGDLNQPVQLVRFFIGDKDEDVAMFQDEEIQYFLDKFGVNPTEKDAKRVALQFLRQMLNELLLGPSRERAGKYEWYGQTAQGLALAVKELEKELSKLSQPKPSFGGVVKADVEKNREDDSLTDFTFYKDNLTDFDNDFWGIQ